MNDGGVIKRDDDGILYLPSFIAASRRVGDEWCSPGSALLVIRAVCVNGVGGGMYDATSCIVHGKM